MRCPTCATSPSAGQWPYAMLPSANCSPCPVRLMYSNNMPNQMSSVMFHFSTNRPLFAEGSAETRGCCDSTLAESLPCLRVVSPRPDQLSICAETQAVRSRPLSRGRAGCLCQNRGLSGFTSQRVQVPVKGTTKA